MVKTLPPKARVMGLIPGQGAKIPLTTWPKKQDIKQKQYCTNSKKTLQKYFKNTSLKLPDTSLSALRCLNHCIMGVTLFDLLYTLE